MCGYKTNRKVHISKTNGINMSSSCFSNGIINRVRGQIKSSFFCQLDYLQVQIYSQTQLPLKSALKLKQGDSSAWLKQTVT